MTKQEQAPSVYVAVREGVGGGYANAYGYGRTEYDVHLPNGRVYTYRDGVRALELALKVGGRNGVEWDGPQTNEVVRLWSRWPR